MKTGYCGRENNSEQLLQFFFPEPHFYFIIIFGICGGNKFLETK